MENGNAPAPKQDMVERRTELKQDVELLRSETHHVHGSLLERIPDSETSLRKASHAFAQSNQPRLAVIETDSDAVRKRVGILEERVLDPERKVHFPQHPPQ